jgi:hypothetical protein
LQQLVANSARGGNGARNNPIPTPTTYGNFTATHPPLFTGAGETLETDHWLHAIESKIGLLRCTENQKTLFIAQQLQGEASAWWANYTAARPTNYQVSWEEFCEALCAHHIPTGVMQRKYQEFMDLKKDGRSVQDYSKLFNHLA